MFIFDQKMPIYRYISYERFLEMLCFQSIVASSPSSWSDKYEQYVLRYVTDEDKMYSLQRFIEKNKLNEKPEETIKRVQSLIQYNFRRSFAICFSQIRDCEPLWRAYSGPGNAVMFMTTAEELMKLNSPYDSSIFFIDPVQYDLENEVTIDNFFKSLSVDKGVASIFDPEQFFRHKRQIFSYEREVRFICSLSGSLTDLKENQKHINLIIPDLSSFFRGVMVSPDAKEAHMKTVERVCAQYNIPFIGRSTVYDMP